MALSDHKGNKFGFLIPVALVLLFVSLIPQTHRRAHWHEQMLANLLASPQRLLGFVSDGMGSLWEGYVVLVGAKRDNERLIARNAVLEGKLVAAEESRLENDRLRALLDFRATFTEESVAAHVVASDPRAEFKSIMIDRGSKDGVALFMPVVGPRGLVGRIGRVSRSSAQVLLLNDPNSAVDAMIQRSRARGMLVGEAVRTKLKSGQYLTRLEYMQRLSDVQDNDVVVTSGLDLVFPSGLPIGTVHGVSHSRLGIFKEAQIIPYENFYELQEVLVLRHTP